MRVAVFALVSAVSTVGRTGACEGSPGAVAGRPGPYGMRESAAHFARNFAASGSVINRFTEEVSAGNKLAFAPTGKFATWSCLQRSPQAFGTLGSGCLDVETASP